MLLASTIFKRSLHLRLWIIQFKYDFKKSETIRFYLPGIPDSLASILLIIFVLSNTCNWLNCDKQTMIEKKCYNVGS